MVQLPRAACTAQNRSGTAGDLNRRGSTSLDDTQPDKNRNVANRRKKFVLNGVTLLNRYIETIAGPRPRRLAFAHTFAQLGALSGLVLK